MKKNLIVLSVFVFVSLSVYSQQTAVYTHPLAEYNRALELYQNKQYQAAQNLFMKIKDETDDVFIESDAAYYIANTAARLNQSHADVLMEEFVEKYPFSLKQNSAQLEIANFHFDSGRYSQAQRWYDRSSVAVMSEEEKERYYFNTGYIHFRGNRTEEAVEAFNKVTDSEKYGAQAKYYLGFIAYEGDDYEKASKIFEEVKEEGQFGKEVSYYQADMNFKQGNFQKAIEIGKSQYDNAAPQEKNQLSKIIGESYFNLKQYDEAIPYLTAYRGTRGKWTNTDYYQLGYAYYKQGDYQKAIGEFNKIISGKDAVAQNAYYHLAESYLRLDQKQQALNAFKNASEMDFSPEIREDAFLNYAKLSYEIGNSYKPTPEVILDFLKEYPGNPANSELRELLIDSYLISGNFKDAMTLMETNNEFYNEEAYQKVAFYRGLELYSDNNYQEAHNAFDKSLKAPRQPIYTARATYWKAETEYHLNQFENALSSYKKYSQMAAANQTPEFENLNYNLGYTHFKMRKYPEAIASFENFVNATQVEASLKKDAYLRIGDSYFVTSKYWPAMESYNKAITISGKDDYAHYQKAISYGFVDRTERKIEELLVFIRNYITSVYRDDALYELGNTYIAENEPQKAIAAYDQLINEIPQSSFVPQALIKQALLYNNAGNSARALTTFKKVVSDYPSSSEARQAVTAAKNIYIAEGRVDEYADWVKNLNFVEFGDSELDDSTYLAAEQPYVENDMPEAKKRFERYLKQFPEGRHAIKANFYLGQIYFNEKNADKALPLFEYVANKERNAYTEQALARVSELYLGKNDYRRALDYLKRLETKADFPQNKMFAQTNIMKASYELGQYAETVTYAEKVLANSQINNAIRSDAQVFIARSAMKTGDEDKAKKAYAEVQKIATGSLAAEALYYEAYFKNKEGKFEASNQVIQKLAKDYSGYKLYGAKGLTLMAKNFYALNDSYQAVYILESVISNFQEFPEVMEEAQAELRKIKQEEAKTNASVDTEE